MAKTPEEMAQSMVANMKEKTGRTLPQWLKLARSSGASKHGELVKWLKSRHGVSHGYANLIAIGVLVSYQFVENLLCACIVPLIHLNASFFNLCRFRFFV